MVREKNLSINRRGGCSVNITKLGFREACLSIYKIEFECCKHVDMYMYVFFVKFSESALDIDRPEPRWDLACKVAGWI